MARFRGPRAWWFRRPALAGCGHPALRTKSMARRRGGYQPPEQALDSRRIPAERRGRAALMAGLAVPAVRSGRLLAAPTCGLAAGLDAWQSRRLGLAGCGHPALRTKSMVHRRGGLYGRPDRLAIFTAPPPNAVGRHAHMPPWPGSVDREPGGSGGLLWRGVGTPPYGPNRWHVVGAAISRPNRPSIPAERPLRDYLARRIRSAGRGSTVHRQTRLGSRGYSSSR